LLHAFVLPGQFDKTIRSYFDISVAEQIGGVMPEDGRLQPSQAVASKISAAQKSKAQKS
jgi:hypothetical protein